MPNLSWSRAFSREQRLKLALAGLSGSYDYILIDSPPSLGLLTINAMTAADSVLIPLQCEFYAMEGLSKILKTIRLVKKSLNSGLDVEGILLTMFDARNKLLPSGWRGYPGALQGNRPLDRYSSQCQAFRSAQPWKADLALRHHLPWGYQLS